MYVAYCCCFAYSVLLCWVVVCCCVVGLPVVVLCQWLLVFLIVVDGRRCWLVGVLRGSSLFAVVLLLLVIRCNVSLLRGCS